MSLIINRSSREMANMNSTDEDLTLTEHGTSQ